MVGALSGTVLANLVIPRTSEYDKLNEMLITIYITMNQTNRMNLTAREMTLSRSKLNKCLWVSSKLNFAA